MTNSSLIKAAAALSLILILSGCATNGAFFGATTKLGIANAGVTIADQPIACGQNTPHAALVKGRETWETLNRERRQLDAANSKRSECFTFNKVQIAGLRGSKIK